MATISKAPNVKKPDVINIHDLSPQQLNQFNQQLEEEMKFLNESLQQLKYLQTQFSRAKETLKIYNPENDDKEVLVPFSSTLYLFGKLKKINTVRLDIGTGYFVDMTIEQAKSYYDRRNDYLEKQIETVRPNIAEKTEMKRKIVEVLNVKITEMIKAAQANAPKSEVASKT